MSRPSSTPPESSNADSQGEVRNIAVIGGGPAAHRCVTELRKFGFAGSITLVSAEPIPPYDRTLLSKDCLVDDAAEIAPMASAGLYDELDVDVRLGTVASSVDADARAVEVSDGTRVRYDRLVLAVGGSATLPAALAAPGVLTMRDAADVAGVRDALERSRHVVVIGGGFIGGEIAAAATGAGCAVTLVEASDVPLGPIFGSEVGSRVAQLHRSRSVDLRCGVQADSIAEIGGAYRVELSDGSTLHGDSVIVGVGMRPATEWLQPSGIEMNRGIRTDSACRTSLPGVLAAGDCAEWWSPRYGQHCHIEHWDTAGKHGAAAARSAVGMPVTFNPLPFFWSDHYDVKYQWAGYAPSWDAVEIDDDGFTEFTASYFDRGELAGVFAANSPRDFARLRKQLLNAPEVPTNDHDEEVAVS